MKDLNYLITGKEYVDTENARVNDVWKYRKVSERETARKRILTPFRIVLFMFDCFFPFIPTSNKCEIDLIRIVYMSFRACDEIKFS